MPPVEPPTPATDSDRPDSRAAILEAATQEFIERGFDGVRMEHVAKRAGYNKALVYKHFTNRTGLFEAVLEAAFSSRRTVLQRQPRGLGDALATWSEAAFAEPAYGKLLMREALEYQGDTLVLAAERQRYYANQIEGVRQAQSLGRLPPGLAPDYLFLALLSVVNLPAFLPNVAGLATGLDPASETFQTEWAAFLRSFAEALKPVPADGSSMNAAPTDDA